MKKLFSKALLSFRVLCFIFGIVMSSVVFNQHSFASQNSENLTPAAKLRRLSYKIRGIPPSMQEYEELSRVVRSNSVRALERHLKNKTKTYLKSNEFIFHMMGRLEELFKLKEPKGINRELWYPLRRKDYSLLQDTFFGAFEDRINALNFLFVRVVRDNLSWDELLLSSEFIAQDVDRYFFMPLIAEYDQAIKTSPLSYQVSKKHIPKHGEKLKFWNLSFSNHDLRVAGVLSTNRFYSRYGNTPLNQNRRRAAAVFRIFLCDEMDPAVALNQESNDRDIALLKLATPKKNQVKSSHPEMNSKVVNPQTQEIAHGTDPLCVGCHSKLDPMGRVFGNTGDKINLVSHAGQLVYRDELGNKINEPVLGLRGLAQAIVKQPQYRQCQIDHFWKWFIGADVPMTRSRREELNQVFDQLGRKPQDWIAYLTSLPEFYPEESFSEIGAPANSSNATNWVLAKTFFQAKPFLQKCTQCHEGVTTSASGTPAPFYPFPIGGSKLSHSQWIRDMAYQLDVLNHGKSAQMPPPEAQWSEGLRKQAQTVLSTWICAGAPNEDGHPTVLTEHELAPSICKKYIDHFKTQTERNFHFSSKQYLSSISLLKTLKSSLDFVNDAALDELYFFQRDILGNISPTTGKPVLLAPTQPYVLWVKSIIKIWSGPFRIRINNYSSEEVKKWLIPSMHGRFDSKLLPKSWEEVSSIDKFNQIQFLVHQLLGLSVLSNEGEFVTRILDQLNSLKPKPGFSEAIIQATVMILTSEEFLSY